MLETAINTLLLVAITMATGYLCGIKGWITDDQKSVIPDFLMHIALPFSIVFSFFTRIDIPWIASNLRLFIVPIISILGGMLIAFIVARICKISSEDRSVFIGVSAFSNAIFVGIPVCTSIFGVDAMPYILVFYFANTTLFWTVLHTMLSSGDSKSKKINFKPLVNPPLITMVICVALIALGISMPKGVLNIASFIGNTVSPLSLVYIGKLIQEFGIKNLRFDRATVISVLYRALIAPIIAFGAIKLLGISGMPGQVLFMQSAMPAMFLIVITQSRNPRNAIRATNSVILTTLLFLPMIPVYMLILPLI